jgi:DNA-binding response OmpR family regulator
MSEQIYRVAGLDLDLDHSRHRATRRNRPPVDFGGNCRQWAILSALAKRFDLHLAKRDLIAAVWDQDDVMPEEVTVWAAISDLRRRLRPLGMTIMFTKGLGYKLAKK